MRVLNLKNGVIEKTEEERLEDTIKSAKTTAEINFANALKLLYDAGSLEDLIYRSPRWKKYFQAQQ